MPQAREQVIEDLLEARHHHHAAGDVAAAVEVSERVCLQLQTWGAWEWEERLLRETLAWMPDGSHEAAVLLHELGIVAQDRGDDDAALDWYRQSLAIEEQLGNRAGMARSLSQIGILYTETAHATAAVPLTLQSLALRLEMQSPEVRIDLDWLSRQRQILGGDPFRAIVTEHLDNESMTSVLARLDAFDQARGAETEALSPAVQVPKPLRTSWLSRLRNRLGC